MKNPSCKIDELAHRVLQAAHWPEIKTFTYLSSSSRSSSSGVVISPTPHLDELERALEIYLPPLSLTTSSADGGGGGGNAANPEFVVTVLVSSGICV